MGTFICPFYFKLGYISTYVLLRIYYNFYNNDTDFYLRAGFYLNPDFNFTLTTALTFPLISTIARYIGVLPFAL